MVNELAKLTRFIQQTRSFLLMALIIIGFSCCLCGCTDSAAEAKTRYHNGMVNYFQGRYDMAIENFNLAVSYQPNYVAAYEARAKAYIKSNYDGLAFKDYEHVVQVSVGEDQSAKQARANAYVSMGQIDCRRSRYVDANQSFVKAINEWPSNYAYYELQGDCYQTQKLYNKAVDSYSNVLARGVEDANIYYKRAISFKSAGNKMEAIKDLEEALKLQPDDSTRERIEQALQELRRT